MRKGKTYIEHFSLTGECSTFFNISDAYFPEVMVLILIQWKLANKLNLAILMVKFSTKLSFDVKLEMSRIRETARIISKVLRVSKETIRTRLRKLT